MPANWSEPTNSSLYTGVLTSLNDKDVSCVRMNPTSDSNIPTDAIRLNATTKAFELWNGSAWVAHLPEIKTDWTPTYGGSGSMTVSGPNTYYARYAKFGKLVFAAIYCDIDLGGTAAPYWTFTAPVAAANIGYEQGVFAVVRDGSVDIAGFLKLTPNSTTVKIYKSDSSNWTIANDRVLQASFVYESA